MKKILFIFGTRPEAIKMAPLVNQMKNDKQFDILTCITGQHREMLNQVLDLFKIIPDFDLKIMKPNQNLSDLTANIITEVSKIIESAKPDCILVHGDTTTTMAASLAAFYHKIDVGHVEAGLRTHNIYSPWPEEINRQITGRISRFHFAPTQKAKENLIKEGIHSDSIHMTGNTVIDALMHTQKIIASDPKKKNFYKETFSFLQPNLRLILVTGHRRENFGKPFEEVCLAFRDIASNHDVQIVYPVHLNPNVQLHVSTILKDVPNVHLIQPVDYEALVYLMSESFMVVTDSGGIQEEAPSLGKPVLVTRDTTERPEGIQAGTALLVGTKRHEIVEKMTKLLTDESFYTRMSSCENPYGDGLASKRISEILASELIESIDKKAA